MEDEEDKLSGNKSNNSDTDRHSELRDMIKKHNPNNYGEESKRY